MKDFFLPAWITCINESMAVFTNPYVPGWIAFSHKPHLFGSEYHTIACTECHVIFFIEVVEGKDIPSEVPNSRLKFEDSINSKIAALVVHMTSSSGGPGMLLCWTVALVAFHLLLN